MTSALWTSPGTVTLMRQPSELVVIQILLIDEPGERPYDRLLSFAGGKRTMHSRVAPLFCTPVLGRVPIEEFVDRMMGTLVTAGMVDTNAAVIATPAVRITAETADTIVNAYRQVTDRITRHVEVAALEASWDAHYDDREP
jgi:hypothetical protein